MNSELVSPAASTGAGHGSATSMATAARSLVGSQLSEGEIRRLSELAADALSPATRRAYESDWRRWERWCGDRCAPMPADPAFVALYLEEHAATRDEEGAFVYSPATLTRWVSSLNQVSRAAGQQAPGEHPMVRTVLSAVRRSRRHVPRQREPLLLDDVSQLCTRVAGSARRRAERIAARRDIAVLTMGFFGGFRRSELSELRLSEVAYHPADGLHVWMGASKTDQEGQGQVKPLPFRDPSSVCPVCALLRWAQVVQGWDEGGRAGLMRVMRAPETEGHVCGSGAPLPLRSPSPVFRSMHRSGLLRGSLSGHAINEMIQRRAQQVGLEPERLRDIGGHSLRAGLVTEGYRAGATAEEIAQQTGHKSLSVLASYRRERAPLTGNAVAKVGSFSPGDRSDDG